MKTVSMSFSKQTVAHRRLLGKYNEFDFGIMLANIMIAKRTAVGRC